MMSLNWENIYHMHRYPIQVMLDAVKDYDVKLICFGSTVKGTATWRSDIDIAYLAKNVEDEHNIANALSLAITDEDYPWFERDFINIRRITKGKLLEEVEKGMLLRDFDK